MKRREKISKYIQSNLAAFIYDQELEYGYDACLERCEQNHVPCPYGEEHGRSDCLQCIEDYLDKEEN